MNSTPNFRPMFRGVWVYTRQKYTPKKKQKLYTKKTTKSSGGGTGIHQTKPDKIYTPNTGVYTRVSRVRKKLLTLVSIRLRAQERLREEPMGLQEGLGSDSGRSP
jgi:hypothetical protein